jgi:hypothetical protein
MIWKIWKKGKLKCEMIWKIWKKGKSKSEKIWKIQGNNSLWRFNTAVGVLTICEDNTSVGDITLCVEV